MNTIFGEWIKDKSLVTNKFNTTCPHIVIDNFLSTDHYDTFSIYSLQDHFVSKASFMNENIQKMDKIKKLEREIKTVEESHDYLNELITVA